jgi:hypothetical protein
MNNMKKTRNTIGNSRKTARKVDEGQRGDAGDLPPLGPPVLEPGLHLGVRHLQILGHLGALRARQVFLCVEDFGQERMNKQALIA